jgi:hypothetical protein
MNQIRRSVPACGSVDARSAVKEGHMTKMRCARTFAMLFAITVFFAQAHESAKPSEDKKAEILRNYNAL